MTECCIRVCTSSQGGLLDNPGLVTAGCANVLDKWDQVMSGEQTKVWQWGNCKMQNEAYMDSQKVTTMHYINSNSH